MLFDFFLKLLFFNEIYRISWPFLHISFDLWEGPEHFFHFKVSFNSKREKEFDKDFGAPLLRHRRKRNSWRLRALQSLNTRKMWKMTSMLSKSALITRSFCMLVNAALVGRHTGILWCHSWRSCWTPLRSRRQDRTACCWSLATVHAPACDWRCRRQPVPRAAAVVASTRGATVSTGCTAVRSGHRSVATKSKRLRRRPVRRRRPLASPFPHRRRWRRRRSRWRPPTPLMPLRRLRRKAAALKERAASGVDLRRAKHWPKKGSPCQWPSRRAK